MSINQQDVNAEIDRKSGKEYISGLSSDKFVDTSKIRSKNLARKSAVQGELSKKDVQHEYITNPFSPAHDKHGNLIHGKSRRRHRKSKKVRKTRKTRRTH